MSAHLRRTHENTTADNLKNENFPPINNQMLQVIKENMKGRANSIICTKFNLNINRTSLRTLKGLNWVDDQVITFYMNLINERSRENSSLPRAYAFDVFFYEILQRGYEFVKKHTRNIDLFSFNIVLIPIHATSVHWCMVVIDMLQKG